MELVKHPNIILDTPSENVELNEEVKKFIEEMEKFYLTGLKWGVPAGLAAPQVGKNWNIFIAQGQVFVNPKITKMSTSTQLGCEGCYSLEENKFFNVKRAGMVRLEWIDKEGNPQKQKFFDFDARVIQHEMDHLEGRLCH